MVSKVKGTEGVEFPDASVQSSAALTAFIGANQSKTPNGYQKLPGGLIIQWGITGYLVGGGTITFPEAFPNACFGVQVIGVVASPSTPEAQAFTTFVDSISAASFHYNLRFYTGTVFAYASEPCYWIAIGH